MGDERRRRRAAALCLLASITTTSAQVNRAIARIRSATEPKSAVSGSVTFEQSADDARGDVTVTVSITGLRAGIHGFHVHQFGDVRVTASPSGGLDTMGAHFVPFCVPPDIGDAQAGTEAENECLNMAKHGLPPSLERQPGDMGNINVLSPSGTFSTVLTIGQRKMSLSDGLRSIVGRTVVVHALEDDGGQPYGNAGPPEAYGVIGLAATPSTASNAAAAPQVPHIDKIICTFEADVSSPISGTALISLLEPQRPGTVRLQARLVGMAKGSSHSFHFHEWGDMTVDPAQLGQIYYNNAINIDSLRVNQDNTALLDVEFASETLQEHVGRSLTIHDGPSSSTPTIAAATCGIAHPHASVDTSSLHLGSSSSLSPATQAFATLTGLVCASMAVLVLLVYFKKPVPFCGKYINANQGYRPSSHQPPPPPKHPQVELRVEGV